MKLNDIMKYRLRFSHLGGTLILGLILLLAFVIRVMGLNFGLPYLYHPDEPFTVIQSRQMLQGNLNPQWPGMHTPFLAKLLALLWAVMLVPMYIFQFLQGDVKGFAEFQQYIQSDPQLDRTLFYLSGRFLMVVLGVLGVHFTYLIGKRYFGKCSGLLAALCLAVAPLHVSASKVIREDIFGTTLMLISFWFVIKYVDIKKTKHLIASSVFAGLSLASRLPTGVVLLPLLIACFHFDLTSGKKCSITMFIRNFFMFRSASSKAMLCSFLTYFIIAPFSVLNVGKTIMDLHQGIILKQVPETFASGPRLPFPQHNLWFIENALIEGIGGVFFAIFALFGLIILCRKKIFTGVLFLISPVVLWVVLVDAGNLLRDYWLIPVLPFEAILFGGGLVYTVTFLVHLASDVRFKTAIIALFGFAVIAAVSVPLKDNIHSGIKLARTDTRTLSKQWIEENLPADSVIAYEYYAPHLHDYPKKDFTLINMDYRWIISQPLSYYIEQDVDYIITTSMSEFRIRPYADERRQELRKNALLIKTFSNEYNPGPIVYVYQIKD